MNAGDAVRVILLLVTVWAGWVIWDAVVKPPDKRGKP